MRRGGAYNVISRRNHFIVFARRIMSRGREQRPLLRQRAGEKKGKKSVRLGGVVVVVGGG